MHMVGILVDAHGWHISRYTCWHVDKGIWLIHSMDDIFWHIVWCWCTWLMYMGVVHGGNILVHDILGGYIVHDSLFHWWHIFCFMMYGMAQVWCMNRSKDRHMVAYCSSCREDSGGHTLRGIHYSSHDSRRRYISDAYLEKRPIFEERAQRHNYRGSDGHRGSMFNVFSALH